MREIEFRGMTEDGRWAYGNLCRTLPRDYIMDRYCKLHQVRRETVGEYIGFTDKSGNGKYIFEGDIIKKFGREKKGMDADYLSTYEIIFKDGCFFAKAKEDYLLRRDGALLKDVFSWIQELIRENPGMDSWVEVVGNIHDNPELLKELKNGEILLP